MTLIVPNMMAPIADKMGKLLWPWNSFFQQFVGAPAPVSNIVVGASPFIYAVGEPGIVYITGGTVSAVEFIRGTTTINVGTLRAVFVCRFDQVKITYTVIPTVKFVPLYSTPQ